MDKSLNSPSNLKENTKKESDSNANQTVIEANDSCELKGVTIKNDADNTEDVKKVLEAMLTKQEEEINLESPIDNKKKKLIEETQSKSQAILKLAMDYRSSDSEDSYDELKSIDSSSESSSSSEEYVDCSDGEDSNKGKFIKKIKKFEAMDGMIPSDLPLIENLCISVPEKQCSLIGKISSIVVPMVMVEALPLTPPLDTDTILFLDKGNKVLGPVYDIIGPVNEPIYCVLFNNLEDIKNRGIEKGLQVYYAPQTTHTKFIFMSDLRKYKGTDASTVNNEEIPFDEEDSSDEAEHKLSTEHHIRPTYQSTLPNAKRPCRSFKPQPPQNRRPMFQRPIVSATFTPNAPPPSPLLPASFVTTPPPNYQVPPPFPPLRNNQNLYSAVPTYGGEGYYSTGGGYAYGLPPLHQPCYLTFPRPRFGGQPEIGNAARIQQAPVVSSPERPKPLIEDTRLRNS